MAASWRADLAVWLTLMLWLGAYRLFLSTSLTHDMPWPELPSALLEGSRFDSVLATAVILPTLAWATLGALTGHAPGLAKLRRYSLILICLVAAVIYGANYEFFRNLGSHLDQRALDLLHDDDGAISSMIWQAHRPLLLLGISLALGVAMIWSALAASRAMPNGWPSRVENWKLRLLIFLFVLNLVIGLLRGFSWEVSPVRIRNAYVTTSTELNRTIPSPLAYWLYAMEDWNSARADVTPEELERALATWRRIPGKDPEAHDLATALAHTAAGSEQPPRHIFIIILEGQHGFPLLPRYRELGWLPHLADLANRGAWFPNYISSGERTNHTLSALISGTFTPDFVIMYDRGVRRPTVAALAPQFQALGYQPRFFYGGYPGWSGLDKFLANQGFASQQGAPHIRQKTGNAWGAWDGELFDHVLQSIDPAQPGLNVILTSTNHSPYDLPAELMPPSPRLPEWAVRWDEQTRRMLNHERYADRELGRFIAAAEKKFTDALFVVLGDHPSFGGNFSLPGNLPLDRLSTPLLLYGAPLGRQRGRYDTVASTLDILPTLMELAAPRGHRYQALGENLFSTTRPSHALGHEHVLGPGWVAHAHSAVVEAEQLELPPGDADPAMGLGREHHRAARVLSREMLRKN
jgi:phosphoglycerol transferase MdoB-like AlkP superfamily enzyme